MPVSNIDILRNNFFFISKKILLLKFIYLETKLSRNYAEPHQMNGVSTHHHGKSNGIICNGNSRHNNNNNYHSEYNNSIRSVETENTYVPSFPSTIITTSAYVENGGSSNGGSSQVSLLNGHSPNGSGMTLDTSSNYDDFFDEYLSASTGVLEFDNDTKIIFQGEEGRVSLIYFFATLK